MLTRRPLRKHLDFPSRVDMEPDFFAKVSMIADFHVTDDLGAWTDIDVVA